MKYSLFITLLFVTYTTMFSQQDQSFQAKKRYARNEQIEIAHPPKEETPILQSDSHK
ncbi:MAG: hypothetical protein RLZZ578_1590 [Bacteroidota bacterium]|jgi:hypothetical protein